MISNGNSIGKLFAVEGGVVKFRHSNNVEELTICETLETALAGIIAGFSPVWSVGGGLGSFRSIRGVKSLKIIVNEDSTELRSVLRHLTRYWKPTIELLAPATNKNFDGSSSITFLPIPKRCLKKKEKPISQETPDEIHYDKVEDFFESNLTPNIRLLTKGNLTMAELLLGGA